MSFKLLKNTLLLCFFTFLWCNEGIASKGTQAVQIENSEKDALVLGAQRLDVLLPMLTGKRIAVVANQTSVIPTGTGYYTHLIDSLIKRNIKVVKAFAPEHGFRGIADAGEQINDGLDPITKIPVKSLYGSQKKPDNSDLKNIDYVVFDIQDVGARFYTYISTLHYVMEACAENGVGVIVLDRPNPNGHYIDGPILEKEHSGFVGMHPIPIVHGMTIGEYAQMINGEGWLNNKVKAQLFVLEMLNYNHQASYALPIKPSPNLPNDASINLYPSVCLFEGTVVSVGRGTDYQFQVIGNPEFKNTYKYSFTPSPNLGSKYPKHNGDVCYGYNLSSEKSLDTINLNWLIEFYNEHQKLNTGKPFFIPYFTKLAGTKTLQMQIEEGWSVEQIKQSWAAGLKHYNEMRTAYLLYP